MGSSWPYLGGRMAPGQVSLIRSSSATKWRNLRLMLVLGNAAVFDSPGGRTPTAYVQWGGPAKKPESCTRRGSAQLMWP